jgi:hypothetical protein
VKERRYLDRTGLQKHRSIADLMRYAALNQGADDLASYDGFVPAEFLYSTARLTRPIRSRSVAATATSSSTHSRCTCTHCSRRQILTRCEFARRARQERSSKTRAAPVCHTPPLYTNNKLTPADGFHVSADARATSISSPLRLERIQTLR